MISFKEFLAEELLIEDRIKTLKEKIFKDGFDTSHDTNAEHKDTSSIVDHFANHADPSRKKTNTQWILNQYKKKNIRQEDHPRIKTALENFETHKSKLEKKDINQYKHISDLEDAVEPHLGTAGSKRQEKKQIKSEGADLIHNDEERGVTVHHLKTEKAACQYGAGTRWCTAATNNNMFRHYNQNGPIHVIQHNGRKYQFHTDSQQFMDERDHDVEFKDIHPDIQQSLGESDHPEIQKANLYWGNHYTKDSVISSALEGNDDLLKMKAAEHVNAKPHHISKALQDEDERVRLHAARNPNANSKHLDQAINDEHYLVRRSVLTNTGNGLKPHHIAKGLDDRESYVREKAFQIAPKDLFDTHIDSENDENALSGAVRNDNLQPHHIDRILSDEGLGREIKAEAINHTNASVENLDKAMDSKSFYVRQTAVMHPKATSDHIMKGIQDRYADVASAALTNPNVNADHLHAALDSEYEWTKYSALKHPLVNSDHIGKALNDPDSSIREVAASHEKATEEHINQALEDNDLHVKLGAISNPNFSSNNITKALNSPNPEIRGHAVGYHKHNLTNDHLVRALHDESSIALTALRSRKIDSSHIDMAMRHSDSEVRRMAVSHPEATQKHWDQYEKDVRQFHKERGWDEDHSNRNIEHQKTHINLNNRKNKEPFQ